MQGPARNSLDFLSRADYGRAMDKIRKVLAVGVIGAVLAMATPAQACDTTAYRSCVKRFVAVDYGRQEAKRICHRVVDR